jgi:sialate O-acetylesterase
MKQSRLLLMMFLASAMTVRATVTLPSLFQSGMVVQRGKAVPVWGKARQGEQVTVVFNKKRYSTEADAAGNWRVDLPKMKAGGPYVMEVNGIRLDDVWVGDVWLCSGQSNIDTDIERVYPQYQKEIDSYTNDKIRLFRVQRNTDTHGPRADVGTDGWAKLSKKSAWHFSAIGYFLGKRMFEETNVAQGIIQSSYGGTPVQAWIAADSLRCDFPLYYRQTQLYQNDEMVAAQMRADQLANDRWFEVLNDNDPGIAGAWNALACDDAGWQPVGQYDRLAEGRNFIGSLWLRQHVHIDARHAGRPARLLLGTLYDQDYTYVNGREVGRTYYQYPPRRYQIPAGLLAEGDNVITVRFVNKQGVPHFIKEKPYMMIFGEGDTLRLGEQWLKQPGVEMPACHNGAVAVQNLPSVLYNGMLYPLHPFALSGVVWYQGESNTGKPYEYGQLLKKLMANWRQLWGEPRLPFVVVQLANFMEPSDQPQNSSWAALREQQRLTVKADPYSALACAIDLGETVDIHPLLKKEVAGRVGLCFDRLVYNKKAAQAPEVVSVEVQGGKVVLTFDQPLRAVAALCEFELAGADGRFVNAEARLDGARVTLSASQVAAPVRVRYAWKDNPLRANCYSLQGLPVVPFDYKLID